MLMRTTPSYKGLQPASERASVAARGASRKSDTKCERLLRSKIWRAGYRFRKDWKDLPGRPDIVFTRARLVVFCDGDFWHGRGWEQRKAKLQSGTNASYWVAKIERNMQRDRRNTEALMASGWTVLRFWETEILRDVGAIADDIIAVLDSMGYRRDSSLHEASSSNEK